MGEEKSKVKQKRRVAKKTKEQGPRSAATKSKRSRGDKGSYQQGKVAKYECREVQR